MAQAYEAYMAECLRLLGENVAGIVKGKYIAAKWFDIIDNKPPVKEKSGDEVAVDVMNKIGLTFGGDTE